MKRFLIILIVGVLISGCQSNLSSSIFVTKSSDQGAIIDAKVVKVIDGDTIKVDVKNHEETIRMLLIDTPETHHPKLGVQPYGPEAASFTKKLLEGKMIQVEPAIDQARDKYGRLLAYLFIDGKSVEEKILEKGLARVAYVIPPNTKYLKEYREAESNARDKKLRIWSVPGYAQDDGFHPEVLKRQSKTQLGFPPDKSGQCGGHIKGNINRSGEKIYHLQSDDYYNETKAERCFMSKQDAVRAGFRAPGY